MAPHMPAFGASIPADRHQQPGGSPPERLVRQLPGDGVAGHALAAAAAAPPIRFEDPACQDCPVGFEPLAGDLQPEPIEPGELGQVRTSKGSVRHVEVLWMGGVGTSIFSGPRRLPGHRPHTRRYTLTVKSLLWTSETLLVECLDLQAELDPAAFRFHRRVMRAGAGAFRCRTWARCPTVWQRRPRRAPGWSCWWLARPSQRRSVRTGQGR